MRRTLKFLAGVAAIAVIAAALSFVPIRAQEKAPSAGAVKIDNFSFSPASITVPVGATIKWTNRDDIPHTVVADDKSFKSKTLDTDEEFSFTFSKPGTYSYFCSLHPKMTGKVVVQ